MYCRSLVLTSVASVATLAFSASIARADRAYFDQLHKLAGHICKSEIEDAEAQLSKMDSERAFANAGGYLAKELLVQISSLNDRSVSCDIAPKLSQWSSAFPKSPWPLLMSAWQHYDLAWKARGHGYSNSVGAEAASTFAEELKKSLQLLSQARTMSPENVTAILVMQDVLRSAGAPDSAHDELFQSGKQLSPDNLSLHTSHVMHLLPVWGGSKDAVLRFSRTVVSNSSTKSPLQILVAHSYMQLAENAPAEERKSWYQSPSIMREIVDSCEKGVAARPTSAFLPAICTRLFSLIGDLKDAEKYYGIAVNADAEPGKGTKKYLDKAKAWILREGGNVRTPAESPVPSTSQAGTSGRTTLREVLDSF